MSNAEYVAHFRQEMRDEIIRAEEYARSLPWDDLDKKMMAWVRVAEACYMVARICANEAREAKSDCMGILAEMRETLAGLAIYEAAR